MIKKNYPDKVKLQDFVVLIQYKHSIFLIITEVQFTDLSSNSSYTWIYMIIRHFRISFTSLSTSFIHFFIHMYILRYNIAIQTCLLLIISMAFTAIMKHGVEKSWMLFLMLLLKLWREGWCWHSLTHSPYGFIVFWMASRPSWNINEIC